MTSLRGERWARIHEALGGTSSEELRRSGLGWRGYPFRPVWLGLAVNTVLYAAVLWPLICGPFVLRRFIRRRHGLCVKCGYPMGESSVCTECGREFAT